MAVRQGHVAFIPRTAIPPGYTEQGTTLEIKGETGDTHLLEGVRVFSPDRKADSSVRESPGESPPIFIIVPEGGKTITHTGSHPELLVPTGIHEVQEAQEHRPNGPRKVD